MPTLRNCDRRSLQRPIGIIQDSEPELTLDTRLREALQTSFPASGTITVHFVGPLFARPPHIQARQLPRSSQRTCTSSRAPSLTSRSGLMATPLLIRSLSSRTEMRGSSEQLCGHPRDDPRP